MPSLVGGIANVAVGFRALRLNTSSYQTGVGFNALSSSTGGYNTAFGYRAGLDVTTGGGNIFVGVDAGLGITTGNNNTIIGSNVTGLSSSLSNTIILADGQGNQRLYINNSGNVGIGTTSPAAITTINYSNTDITNTGGANSHILMTNSNASGQSVVSSLINGSLRAKWRTDFAGNVNWVAFANSATQGHNFFVGGDFGTGKIQAYITNAGSRFGNNLTAAATITYPFEVIGNSYFSTGMLIGTTVSAGYMLDVNGTARVSAAAGNADFSFTNASAGKFRISVNNFASSDFEYSASDRYVRIYQTLLSNCVAFRDNIIDHNGALAAGTYYQFRNGAYILAQAQRMRIDFNDQVSTNRIGLQLNYGSGAHSSYKSFQINENSVERINVDVNYNFNTSGGATFGSLTPESSALVSLTSTTKGFLPPRMTNAQMVAIATPASGLMVYDTTNNKLNYYNGTAWVAL